MKHAEWLQPVMENLTCPCEPCKARRHDALLRLAGENAELLAACKEAHEALRSGSMGHILVAKCMCADVIRKAEGTVKP